MEELEVKRIGYKIIDDIVIGGDIVAPAGTVITNAQLESYGFRDANQALKDIKLLEIFNIDEIDQLRNNQGTENLEIIKYEYPTEDPLYVNVSLQTNGFGQAHDHFYPPVETKVGIRDKQTKDIIVPTEYTALEIINKSQVLVNHWLLIDLYYLDGTLLFNDGHNPQGYNGFHEVMYKIASGDYQFVHPYLHGDKMCVYLVKAEPVYQVTMSNLSQGQLIELKKLVQDNQQVLVNQESHKRVRKV